MSAPIIRRYARTNLDPFNRRAFVAFTIAVIMLAIVDISSHGFIRGYVREAAGSIISAVSSVWNVTAESGFLMSGHQLALENAQLKTELAAYQSHDVEQKALEIENARMRALLHFPLKTHGIGASIMSSFRASPNGNFTISVGSRDGVAVGNLVMTDDGFVLAHVIEASARSSLAALYFSPGAVLDAQVDKAMISLDGEAKGTAHGRLSQGLPLAPGDVVTAPQTGNRPVGVVGAIKPQKSGAYNDVYIGYPQNIESISLVYVIANE